MYKKAFGFTLDPQLSQKPNLESTTSIHQAPYITIKTVSTAALLALVPAALANFDIYHSLSGGNGISANIRSFSFFNGEPSCDEARDSTIWPQKSDLSSHFGVRCKADGDNEACYGSVSPSGIEEFEIKINEEGYHWTFYRNRDWGLFDTDDNKIGDCYPYPNHEYDCSVALGQIRGKRVVRCETSITATDIKENEGWVE